MSWIFAAQAAAFALGALLAAYALRPLFRHLREATS